MKKIQIIEKQVIVPGTSSVRYPSLQFSIDGTEVIKKQELPKIALEESEDGGLKVSDKNPAKKKKQKVEKEVIPVSMKRRLTATQKTIVIDTVKNNEEIIEDYEQLVGENLKNMVRRIDNFIVKPLVKERIYEYFDSKDQEERTAIAYEIQQIANQEK